MEKNLANMIRDRAVLALQTAFAIDPLLKHIKVSHGGGRIEACQTTLEFSFLDSTYTPPVLNPLLPVAPGRLPPGTKINYGGKQYTIVKARTKRYLVSCSLTGRQYSVPFYGVTAAHVVKAQPPSPNQEGKDPEAWAASGGTMPRNEDRNHPHPGGYGL